MINQESSWKLKTNKTYPKLDENIKTDVVIIGAGMAGLFNAYVLAKAGIKVVVLEKNKKILQGATLATTAFIVNAIDTSFTELISLYGETKAKLIWQSGQEAIKLFASITKEENIDCEFQMVSEYNYASNRQQFKELAREYAAIKNHGFEVKLQETGEQLNFRNLGFLEILGQAKFQPIKFAEALADKAESLGVKIYTDSEVLTIEGLTVKTKYGEVSAQDIVIGTHAPLTNEGTYFKKGMYVSYVFELEITKGLIAEGLYQDMHNPYHYFRLDSFIDFDRLIIGGEDNRKDIRINEAKNFYALEQFLKTILGNNPYKITRQWSGPILEPVDGLALIGAIKPHTYVATAFSGNGMTYSAISAKLICDLILGKKNEYADLYDPLRHSTLRTKFIKGIDYVEEFFGGIVKNFFLPKK